MKLLTFHTRAKPDNLRLGAWIGEAVVDLAVARTWAQGARALPLEPLPGTSLELLYAGREAWQYVHRLVQALEGQQPARLKGAGREPVGYPLADVVLYPPLPRPSSLRDFYAFEQHVATAHANRGRPVPEAWYQMPVFYFSNHNAIFSSGEIVPYPASSQALDYELEVACVIGKAGRDIRPEEAEEHIFGYTIFNDWSARDVQREEMRAGLGPAKGKDFASSLGPWIVTPEELADRHAGRPGVYDLAMVARVNGVERSRGNWRDLHYSFGQMVARASADTWLLPGDVIGSGTVGTGCLLELTKGQGPWLQPGDVVELEVESLGVLRNRVGERSTKAGTTKA
jgi:fumarylacetoacetate (FAA) hydrolase